jgi:hypothetical protein
MAPGARLARSAALPARTATTVIGANHGGEIWRVREPQRRRLGERCHHLVARQDEASARRPQVVRSTAA